MKQVAVIPYKRDAMGEIEVLLVTSRETGRWVIPKGWRMKGLPDHKAAAEEALQEAGVKGRVDREPVGGYHYFKRFRYKFELVEVSVFLLEVDKQLSSWSEEAQRKRCWFSIADAKRMVDEPGLMSLLATLASHIGRDR